MNWKNISGNVGTIIGGAAIGAGIMYLLDPDKGKQRRQKVAEAAEDIARRTGETASSVYDKVREKASELGERASSRMHKTASDVTESAGDYGARARYRLRRILSGRRPTTRLERMGVDTGWKRSLAIVGVVGLASGGTFLLLRDPFRRRRIMRSVGQQGRFLWDFISGKSRQFASRISPQQPQDQRLFEQIRSEIGRCVGKPSLISVESRRGRVTLSGPVLGGEADRLLRSVWATPGVREVINRLEIHESLGTFPGVQTSEDAPVGVSTEANRM